MGISGLWDEICSGELVSLAQLSTDCMRQRGRPFRIAVDEAGWRFNNLTPQQVAAIKAREPAARPVEKAILYRVISLLQLNIQLLFVFDGPKRPWKRGRRGGGKIEAHCSWEAEAECARLQQEGIVDAVWTDDGDALMFGTTTLIKTHRETNGVKSQTHVRVFKAEDIRKQYGLDRDGFVLFAVLSGGDYETKGLPGCGPKTSLKLAQQGLGAELRGVSLADMHVWRQQLQYALRGSSIEVPMEFPNIRALKYYTTPTVSTLEQIHNLRALQKGWDLPLNEAELRVFLRTHYNIQIKAYLKHIVPILLMRTLCTTSPGLERTNNIYSIEVVRSRKRKGDDASTLTLERKITYLPQTVTSLDLITQPGGPLGEDWTSLSGKNGEPFDARARVGCVILEHALQMGVPHILDKAVAAASVPAGTQKRKKLAGTADEERTTQEPPRKRKSHFETEALETTNEETEKPVLLSECSTNVSCAATSGKPKPRTTFRRPPSLYLNDTTSSNSIQHSISLTLAGEGLCSTNIIHSRHAEVVFESTTTELGPQQRAAMFLGRAATNDDTLCEVDDLKENPSNFVSAGKEVSVWQREESPRIIRARRLAHFDRGTKMAPAARGRSVEEAIVLD